MPTYRRISLISPELSASSSMPMEPLSGVPEWSKAVKSAALEAASSSTRGSGGAPSGPASSWECRAAQSHQARPEEAQEPSWGTAKGHCQGGRFGRAEEQSASKAEIATAISGLWLSSL